MKQAFITDGLFQFWIAYFDHGEDSQASCWSEKKMHHHRPYAVGRHGKNRASALWKDKMTQNHF